MLDVHVVPGDSAAGALRLALGENPVGDDWIFWRLRRLAGLGVPLLSFVGDGRRLRGMTVDLIPAGRDVLDHSKNALDLNPIDDWVGGVHLDSRAGGTWVTHAGFELNDMPLPSSGLQLTWRLLAAAPSS